MPNQIVDNNVLLLDRCTSAQAKFNGGSRLRLFQTAMVPSPADTLAMYAANECTFTGYAPVALGGGWQAAAKIQDGEYQTMSQVVNYSSPAISGNTIYGLFVDDGGTNLLFAMLFDTAIVFQPGSPALALQIAYQVWAKSILP
jgi:hypothetical protein